MVSTRASSASASVMGTRNRGRRPQAPRPAIPNRWRKNSAPSNRPPLRCRPASRQKDRQKKSCRTRAPEVAAVGFVEALVDQLAKGSGDGQIQVGKPGATPGRGKSKRRSGSGASLNRPMGRRKRSSPDNRRRQKTRLKRIREVAGVGGIDVTIEPVVRGMEEPQSENRSAEVRTARALNCNHEDSEPVDSSRPEEGWTKDQELALHNAYFLVRPSSKFWLEISKKVPGKTAKECFDKFYSAHPTPPAPQTRSQKPVTESPVRSISFSSPMSVIKSRHHLGKGKQVLLKAHQTVRHILRKQQVADGSYEADVFATVEQANPTVSSLQICLNQAASPLSGFETCSNHSESLAVTPNHSFNLISSRKGIGEVLWRSMSAKKKELRCRSDQSRSSTKVSVQGQLLSPEVLKTESNPGRLDRYLDMLHLRRIDKKKSSLHKGRAQGSSLKQEELITRSNTEKVVTLSVSAARDAIAADAKEILRTALHQQGSGNEITNLLHDDNEESSSLIFDE